MSNGRRTGDRGNGALSTVFGVMVFLTLLLFASHLLLNLWILSSVDSVAQDAATDVATSGVGDAALTAVEHDALGRARVALGRYADRVQLEFEPAPPSLSSTGAGSISIPLRAPELTLLPGAIAAVLGDHGLDRHITVSRELPTEEEP